MSLYLGNTKIGSLYLGGTKVVEAYLGATKVYEAASPVDPYNPLNLPSNTIRARFSSGYTPSMGVSQTLVDASTNTWDIEANHGQFYRLFPQNTYLTEILGANTTEGSGIDGMFNGCTALQRVALFDTSPYRVFDAMFKGCTSLISVPLFDMSGTSSASFASVVSMFDGCTAVESGALALYNHLASVFPSGGYHFDCFKNCGANTVTGAAELAQIPADWGGNG